MNDIIKQARANPPRIALEDIEWDEIGEKNPKHRLFSTIIIGNVRFHVDAREVAIASFDEAPDDGFQTIIEYPEDLDRIGEITDCWNFQTVTIGDRDYFLIITPYGA